MKPPSRLVRIQLWAPFEEIPVPTLGDGRRWCYERRLYWFDSNRGCQFVTESDSPYRWTSGIAPPKGSCERSIRSREANLPAKIWQRSARSLRDSGATLVGIDSLNIDDTSGGSRPVHSVLLAAGIPIVEHLTHLAHLPVEGFRFFAVPPKIAAMGTFPVRAHARVGSLPSLRQLQTLAIEL